MPVTAEDGRLVLALVRGDDRLDEARLEASRRRRPAGDQEEIRRGFGADPGSIGPIGFDGEVVADETLREGQFVAGANRTGRHLRGVEAGVTTSPVSPTSASRVRATRARTAAGGSVSRSRSRSATS